MWTFKILRFCLDNFTKTTKTIKIFLTNSASHFNSPLFYP